MLENLEATYYAHFEIADGINIKSLIDALDSDDYYYNEEFDDREIITSSCNDVEPINDTIEKMKSLGLEITENGYDLDYWDEYDVEMRYNFKVTKNDSK